MRLEGLILKAWGSEHIWATNDYYCGKLLNFNKGARSSMIFHATKDKSWYVLSGKFIVRWINALDASIHDDILEVGDTWNNPPLFPNQLICVEAGTVLEVSTADSIEDNYRVYPGDSQMGNSENDMVTK